MATCGSQAGDPSRFLSRRRHQMSPSVAEISPRAPVTARGEAGSPHQNPVQYHVRQLCLPIVREVVLKIKDSVLSDTQSKQSSPFCGCTWKSEVYPHTASYIFLFFGENRTKYNLSENRETWTLSPLDSALTHSTNSPHRRGWERWAPRCLCLHLHLVLLAMSLPTKFRQWTL